MTLGSSLHINLDHPTWEICDLQNNIPVFLFACLERVLKSCTVAPNMWFIVWLICRLLYVIVSIPVTFSYLSYEACVNFPGTITSVSWSRYPFRSEVFYYVMFACTTKSLPRLFFMNCRVSLFFRAAKFFIRMFTFLYTEFESFLGIEKSRACSVFILHVNVGKWDNKLIIYPPSKKYKIWQNYPFATS